MNFHLLRVHRVDEVRHDSWPLGLPFISSFVVDWGSLHQKRHRVSESPTNFGSIASERSYCRTESRLYDFHEIRPTCGPKYGRELVILCHFCEGFMEFFPAHPIASHRAVVQGICNFLKFLVRQKPGVVPILGRFWVTQLHLWTKRSCWIKKVLMYPVYLPFLEVFKTQDIESVACNFGYVVMWFGLATRSIARIVAAMAGSTRKIHVLGGAVHVVVDRGSTAGDS